MMDRVDENDVQENMQNRADQDQQQQNQQIVGQQQPGNDDEDEDAVTERADIQDQQLADKDN